MIDQKILNALSNPKIEFFFIPSATLKQIISAGVHPLVEYLSPEEKSDLLSGYGIAMEAQLVKDYLNRDVNERLLFILDNSEIRVLGAEEIVLMPKEQRNVSA